MIDPLSETAIINQKKYLHPPTWENIEEFMKLIGTHNKFHIERFYGMPSKLLSSVKCGKRTLPFQYWHIIYEKVYPTYGIGFIGDYIPHIPIKETRMIRNGKGHLLVLQKNIERKTKKPASINSININHNRLAKLK